MYYSYYDEDDDDWRNWGFLASGVGNHNGRP
jgi:hypothetical protein